MLKQIILLSGPVSSGKSNLAKRLRDRHGLTVVSTRELIRQLEPNVEPERKAMQRAGERLDRKTEGGWVAEAVGRLTTNNSDIEYLVVDAVRIRNQIAGLRRAYGSKVIHIHLTASDEVLRDRYLKKQSPIQELPTYADVQKNATERNVKKLAEFADVVINTDRCLPEDISVRAASHIGIYGRTFYQNVDVLVGGQYGSEGKGQVVAFLSKEYDYLVRVGGPNAGHKVWASTGSYTFHHLPSGTRSSDAKLIIGAGAVLRLPDLLKEIAEHTVRRDRLVIDPNAILIEDEDIVIEKELEKSIGSTARGVGAATARKILRTIAKPKVRLVRNEPELAAFMGETREILEKAHSEGKKILLEGTQGTALSIHHGMYPYVTSRDTTVAGCLAEAGISPARVRKIVMVCRTYPIRVQSPEDGTSGYMSQEISLEEIHKRSGIPLEELQRIEKTSTTNKKRRIAEFDWTLIRMASCLNSPTDIALTFSDYFTIENQKARRFEQLSIETINFIEELEKVASAPVSLISTRFHSRSIIDRRMW
ncbi:MAG TPA: adenylosuccinate synthetase [Gammaproteobacteria bacterium]